MNFNEQKLYIYEKIIENIGEIFNEINVSEKNFNYTGIGKYEFISKLQKFDCNNYLIRFEINDRKNNHKNLFEWNYLYNEDFNSEELKEKLSNNLSFLSNGCDDLEDEEDYYEYEEELEYIRENNKKLLLNFEEEKKKRITTLLFKVFNKDIYELEEIIKFIIKNEYNKNYKIDDLLYFDKSILKKKDKKLFEKGDDFYYLYYLKFKKPNEFEIIGFYSLPFSEKVLEENFKSILENQSFGLEVSEIKKIQFNDYRFEKTKRKIESYKEDFKRAISEFIILYENAGIDR